MPIPLPNLDERRWTDLFEDGRAQINRYAPLWTDHNIHDPGITLIDLFAWLGEMTDYRLNRVPSRHKRKFLELLGFDIKGPTPANATLSFTPASGTAPFVLPAGSEFEGTDPDQHVVPLRTLRDVTVAPSLLEAVQVDDGSGTLADRTHDFGDGFAIRILGAAPQPGAALYLGFDALTPGLPFTLQLRFAGPGNDAAERQRILDEAAAQARFCKPVNTRLQCVPQVPDPPPELPPHHSAGIVWEAFTTSGWAAVSAADDTRSLTLDGFVTLTLPASIAATALATVPTLLFYVRCRMAAGVFDAIPVLLDIAVNAASAEQAVPVTTRFTIKAGIVAAGPAPSPGDAVQLTTTVDDAQVIQSLSFGVGAGPLLRVWEYNTAGAAAGNLTLDVELAGIGSGLPDQSVSLRAAPLDNASLEIYTLAGGAWQQWNVRLDLDPATRTDFDCMADPVTGIVTFGSGERGQTPPASSLIFARYRTTFADGGNLAARVINRARTSPVNDTMLNALPAATRASLSTIATNRAAAIDGAASESLKHALGSAVAVLHAHEQLLDLATRMKSTTLDQINGETVRALVPPTRGVNLIDLERIALSVPGTRVDRARAWASLHPDYPCLEAPGVVTIVIVPDYPIGMPTPSPGLIDRVWRYLNRRRLVCTTLQVSAPQYVEVTVTTSIQGRTGASAPKTIQRIVNALLKFLDPLTGGPDGLGWPFGRSVFRSEILQLIQNVPGVDHVVSMSMQSDTGPSQCGDISLCPIALTRSGPHQIEVL